MDDVSKIIKEAIENTIGGNAYQHDKVNHWTKTVVDNCLGVLTKLQKPYKYIGELHAQPDGFANIDRFVWPFNFYSYMHDNAKERCRIAYSQLMLLE